MLKSSLCDHSDVCILVKGTITVVGTGVEDAARAMDRNNKQTIFKDDCKAIFKYLNAVYHLCN